MKCPGQDSRYWDEAAIFEAKCPECSQVLEFFKDDSTRTCRKCGHKMLNPRIDFGCASYCPYAEQCLGSLPPELAAKKQELIKDKVAIELKRHCAGDFKRFGRASKAMQYAEEIGREESCLLAVVLVAALLYDFEKKGLDLDFPKEILTAIAAEENFIREVGDLLGNAGKIDLEAAEDSIELRVLHDAVLLVRMEEEQKEDPQSNDELAGLITSSFHTEKGVGLAREVLVGKCKA